MDDNILHERINRAIVRVEDSRASHQAWLDHWADGCDCEKDYLRTVGSSEDQRVCIDGYNNVLIVLKEFSRRLDANS